MSYREDIEKIKNPKNIREALCASSPYTLRKAFENDETVSHLIKAGREVAPLLTEELKNGITLNEITLSCFIYIFHKVDPTQTVNILKQLFAEAMKSPGAFFVYFAAHILRQESNLSTKPLQMDYTRAELQETLKQIS
jgi:hypothetical protein